MKRYSSIRRRRMLEARRVGGLGRVRRGRVSRYPGIENIVNDDLSNIGEQLTYFRVEETAPGEYELFGPVYRYVDFTYKGVRFHAMSSGAGYLGLEEDGRTVYAEVLFAGSKYSDYIELTSLDDIELNSDEEDALLEQVVKRTNVVETVDIIDELRDDKYTVDWVRSELKEYANTNESRRRVIESRGRARRKAGIEASNLLEGVRTLNEKSDVSVLKIDDTVDPEMLVKFIKTRKVDLNKIVFTTIAYKEFIGQVSGRPFGVASGRSFGGVLGFNVTYVLDRKKNTLSFTVKLDRNSYELYDNLYDETPIDWLTAWEYMYVGLTLLENPELIDTTGIERELNKPHCMNVIKDKIKELYSYQIESRCAYSARRGGRLKASGGVHGRLRRRSVMEGKRRNPVKKTSLAERIFRVTRGESLWKLNS